MDGPEKTRVERGLRGPRRVVPVGRAQCLEDQGVGLDGVRVNVVAVLVDLGGLYSVLEGVGVCRVGAGLDQEGLALVWLEQGERVPVLVVDLEDRGGGGWVWENRDGHRVGSVQLHERLLVLELVASDAVVELVVLGFLLERQLEQF